MTQMDARIILAGQQPNMVNTLAQSTAAAGMANQVQSQNALRSLYQTQGPGIVNGEPDAMNALAQLDPEAALGVQDTRQTMQARGQRMGALSAAEKRAVEEYARQKDAAELQAERAQIEDGIKRGIAMFQAGDLPGLNQLLVQAGEPPLDALEGFPAVAARYDGMLDILTEVMEFGQGPERKVIKGAEPK